MHVVQACLALLALAGTTVFAIRAGRRHAYIPVGWLWYVGTLVPVIGLVQAGGQAMADRYMYVPSIGLFVIVAWGVAELGARWRYGRAALPWAAACAMVACAAAARAQVQYWSDSVSLWQHALDVTEGNWVAENNMGGALLKQGRVAEAAPYFNEALRINPHSAEAQANLGMALMGTGKLDEAGQRFAAAVRMEPGYAQAHDGLGSALSGQGRLDEAVAQYQEALRIIPDYAEAHNDLGVALGRQEKLNDAIHEFEEALRIKPDYKDAMDNLKLALAMRGKAGQ
jgi:tetratricopeptide (TPR) repeat protein